jgi:hypothetical protein
LVGGQYADEKGCTQERDPVAWADLLDGRIDLADLNWDAPLEGYEGPSISYPPDEPLSSE